MNKTIRQTSKSSLSVDKDTGTISTDVDANREMIEAVFSKPRTTAELKNSVDSRINGVVIGTLSKPGVNGQTMVHFPGVAGNEPIEAISTESMTSQKAGSEIALGFVNGNPARPIILGAIQKDYFQEQSPTAKTTTDQTVNVQLDGEKLLFNAEREIVFKCGKSSITLTRAGKIIIKGAYLSNHSTGVNRIKGGSVQIN